MQKVAGGSTRTAATELAVRDVCLEAHGPGPSSLAEGHDADVITANMNTSVAMSVAETCGLELAPEANAEAAGTVAVVLVAGEAGHTADLDAEGPLDSPLRETITSHIGCNAEIARDVNLVDAFRDWHIESQAMFT